MKITLVLTGLGMGGAERQVCDLADEFVAQGNQVQLVVLNSEKEAKTAPKSQQIPIHFLNMKKTPIGLFLALLKLKKIISAFQPDVVHCHMFHANVMGRLSRLFVKFPKLVCTAHNTNEGGNLRMKAYRYTNFLADVNTNVSEEAVQAFIQRQAVGSDEMFAMQNGIDTARFQKNIEVRQQMRNELGIADDFVFLAVGRLQEQKDYPNMLNAFKLVVDSNPVAKLVIVGIGELESDLRQLVQKLGISNKVTFLGLRRDIPQIMNIADVYVMSSKYEGLPLVLGESMATENVIVTTNCGGTKEILNGNGFLVSPQNHQALADAMQKAMRLSIEERTEIGKKARKHIVENYSLSQVARKWLAIYQGK